MIELVLTLGPTDNRRHVISRNGRFLVDSPEYRGWKETAVREAASQLPKGWKPLEAASTDQLPYAVEIALSSRRSDAANYDKGLRDVLTLAGAWEDDKYALPQFLPVISSTVSHAVVILPETPEERAAMLPRNSGDARARAW